jgi:hypothetical protein
MVVKTRGNFTPHVEWDLSPWFDCELGDARGAGQAPVVTLPRPRKEYVDQVLEHPVAWGHHSARFDTIPVRRVLIS